MLRHMMEASPLIYRDGTNNRVFFIIKLMGNQMGIHSMDLTDN